MSAQIIDGKSIAANLRADMAKEVEKLKTSGITPGLAVILVGDDPASQVYVGSKIKACKEVGIESFEHKMPASSSEQEIRHVIKNLNENPDVHGILLQLPLPDHLSEVQEDLVQTIAPEKDVDGLTTTNAGKLFLGHNDGLVPCTPQGSLKLIHSVETNLSGKHAVIIGRSNLFGKPMAQLLLQENCTVTTAHSRTQSLPELCAQADILVAAVGRPKMVQDDWVKPDAIVIDVGINRMENGKLCGDVDFDTAKEVASALTPVPGGVGPMTIACLMENTLKAAQAD
ncbi:MAG: bifunctional methylenetetrahydrofolate dehydrogenase/methenyltetrahydrofolate cyclohydrolase FolD [Alphaproteobacteria bacterium]|nr:bifunctional methylenetetrahydrofolate dehydrogenase/methenyltetrahydrofolate cyclohydrolase FolD [Alphaproteobacteria bacterium]